MAYTASALSFMLQYLCKSVILTGSQVPLAQLRTDAIENFVGALIMAGRWGSTISESGLFFNNTLFRGNRTTKVNASGFAAFDSPNYPPLAKVGVDVTGIIGSIFDITMKLYLLSLVNTDFLLPISRYPLVLRRVMDSSVGVFMLFPGITGTMAS